MKEQIKAIKEIATISLKANPHNCHAKDVLFLITEIEKQEKEFNILYDAYQQSNKELDELRLREV